MRLSMLAPILILMTLAMPGMAAAQTADTLAPARPAWTDPLPESTIIPSADIPAPIPGTLSSPGAPQPALSDVVPVDQIPKIILDETAEIEMNCRNNYLQSSFHDCECLAVKFLDARLLSDPEQNKDRVLQSVTSQCADETKIAGFIYTGCIGFMRFTNPDSAESFCGCASNQVAVNYTRNPLMSLRYIENLRRNAYNTCGVANLPPSRGSND